MNIKIICACIMSFIPVISIFSMEFADEAEPLPEYKRIMIEEWISKIPKPRSTIQTILPDEDIDFAAPKIFFKYVCQNCFYKDNLFENFQQHCRTVHNLYLCPCGKSFLNKYAFKWHTKRCKRFLSLSS